MPFVDAARGGARKDHGRNPLLRMIEVLVIARNTGAKILVALGCVDLVFSVALHWFGAYPHLSAALRASNLSAPLQAALRAVFLLVGWNWIVIAIVALTAFTRTRLRKPLVMFCGIALFVETGLTLHFVGVFIGSELIGSAALLLILGSLLLGNPPTETATS